jgi:hypothetical protein
LGDYYFRGSRDYVTAKPHFQRALTLTPNNPDALAALAHIERRQGDFRDASIHFRAALQLDPLNAILAYNTADTFVRLRDYEAASLLLERSLKAMPHHVALVKLRGDLYVAWRGDLGPMREDIFHRDPKLPTPDLYLMDKIDWLILEGRVDDALATLKESKLDVLEGQSIYLCRAGYEALLLQLKGDTRAAKSAAERALPEVMRELQRRPNDGRILLHAGQMYAILGHLTEGERLVRRTLTPGDMAAADAFDRGFFLRALGIMFAMAGEDAKARDVLRALLKEPNQTSVQYLNLHPALRRLRDGLDL